VPGLPIRHLGSVDDPASLIGGRDVLRYGGTSLFDRTGEPLLWYAGAGHELRTGPHYYHDASTRGDASHVNLQLTLRGCGFYRRKGGDSRSGDASQPRTLLTPNRAFIDFIPSPFEYGWAGEAPGANGIYEQVFVSMQGEVVRQITQHIHRAHGPVLDFGSDQSVAETMLAFVEYVRHADPRHASPKSAGPNRYLVSGQLFGLLMQVLAVLSRSRELSAPLVSQAVRLIEANAHDPRYSIARLARTLDCSREHLAREFRRATGVSPLDYLTRRRVRLVAGELRSDRHKLDSIAPRCGFSSAAYLCRVFRKVAGVTPQQYRARPWLVLP
jgi:AraC-like DNA-binding protein